MIKYGKPDQKKARIEFAKSLLSCLEVFFKKYDSATLLRHDKAYPDRTRIQIKHANGNGCFLTLYHEWQPDGRGLIPHMFSLVIEHLDGKVDLDWYGQSYWNNDDPFNNMTDWDSMLQRINAILEGKLQKDFDDAMELRYWLAGAMERVIHSEDPCSNIIVAGDKTDDGVACLNVYFKRHLRLQIPITPFNDKNSFRMHGTDIINSKDTKEFICESDDFGSEDTFNAIVIKLIDWIKGFDGWEKE